MNKNIKIAVVGAGIAGLALASLLRAQDLDITLFEKFPRPRPLGSGLLLQQTGLAVLAQLGLDQVAIEQGAKITRFQGISSSDSKLFDLAPARLNPEYFSLGIHRHSLFQLLYEKVLSLKINVITSFQVTEIIQEKNSQNLLASDGRRSENFDLIIDASGAHSQIRDKYAVLYRDHPFAYGALWGVCQAPADLSLNILRQGFHLAKFGIGLIPIGKKPGAGDIQHLAIHWSIRKTDYELWLNTPFEQWKSSVISLFPETSSALAQFASHADFTFADYREISLKRLYAGSIVFIGDAGHSISPRLGQGANLSLVDALVLSRLLASSETIEEALLGFDKARKSHINFYRRAGRWMTYLFQSDSRVIASLRDIGFMSLGRLPYLQRQMLMTICGIKTGLFSNLELKNL